MYCETKEIMNTRITILEYYCVARKRHSEIRRINYKKHSCKSLHNYHLSYISGVHSYILSLTVTIDILNAQHGKFQQVISGYMQHCEKCEIHL